MYQNRPNSVTTLRGCTAPQVTHLTMFMTFCTKWSVVTFLFVQFVFIVFLLVISWLGLNHCISTVVEKSNSSEQACTILLEHNTQGGVWKRQQQQQKKTSASSTISQLLSNYLSFHPHSSAKFFFHLIFLVLHLIHLVLKCCKNFVELFSGYYSPKFLNELLLYNGRKEAKNILLNNNIKEKHIFCSCSSSARFY